MITKIKIIFAKNIGFCFGVKRAIAVAEKALKEDPKPVQFLGNLVHNETVIKMFKEKGVIFIKDPREVKEGTLIIQAHGFPPLSKKMSKKLIIRDATCLLVKKAQSVAQSFYENGYQVIILGEKNHPEIRGINGYIKNRAIIIENHKETKDLVKFKKIGFLSQTTQTLNVFQATLEILKKKTKKLEWVNTICPETHNRQKELDEILKLSDGVLVIGSKKSANTRKLAERVKLAKKKLFFVNSLKDLKKQNLKTVSVLGVVSGTSTPNWEIEKIKNYLKKYD